MILGHAHPDVVAVIQAAAEKGSSDGAPTEAETAMAERLRDAVPSMEMSRLVSSGTEATMGALRVARGYAGCARLVEVSGGCAGCAGHRRGEGGRRLATRRGPDTAGAPAAIAGTTLVVPYDDAYAVGKV